MTERNVGNTIYMVCAMLLLCLPVKAQQVDTSARGTVETVVLKPVGRDGNPPLQEVVVTGQYGPQSIKSSVYRVRTITQERIAMRGATEIMGVLNNELGFRFSNDNTLGETDTKIMGMGGQRVKILLDGVPLLDRDATKQSLGQIDINSIERIEVVEGPMSVVYGSDALAGVINIITKKHRKENFSISARVQEESVGKTYSPFTDEGIHHENVSLNWQKKGFRMSAYGTRNDLGGWNDTAAYPAKTWKPKKQWFAGGTAGYRNNHINAWYRLDYLHEELFAAGVMSTNTYAGLDKYYITDRATHQAQIDWTINRDLSINTALSYQDYSRSTESYYIDYRTKEKTIASDSGFWDVSKFNTWYARSTAQWRISRRVSVQPGIEVKYDKSSGERIAGTPSITDVSVFASAEIRPVDEILIRPGIRYSNNSVYDAPPVIPSLNTKFILNKQVDLRLSYARGFRAPILRELYFSFHDASHDIDGNPDLKAEYSNSFMGSLNWQKTTAGNLALTSAVTGFYNDYHDFITLAFSDAIQAYTYFNVTRYKTVGGTWENTASYRNLSATLGFSYLGYYNEYADNKTVAGNHSTFAWSPELNSNISWRFPRLDAQVGLFYKFNGALPAYELNTAGEVVLSKVASYHWADVTASKKLFKYLTLQAGVKNLFNIKRVQNSSANVGGAHSTGGPVLTAYGTSFFAGVQFQWSK